MYLGDDCEDVNLGYVRIHTNLNESIYIKLKRIPPLPLILFSLLQETNSWVHITMAQLSYHAMISSVGLMIDSFHEQNFKNNNWFSRIVSFKSIICLDHVLILHWANYNLSPTQISWFHVQNDVFLFLYYQFTQISSMHWTFNIIRYQGNQCLSCELYVLQRCFWLSTYHKHFITVALTSKLSSYAPSPWWNVPWQMETVWKNEAQKRTPPPFADWTG